LFRRLEFGGSQFDQPASANKGLQFLVSPAGVLGRQFDRLTSANKGLKPLVSHGFAAKESELWKLGNHF
jgi:hypothetical protein